MLRTRNQSQKTIYHTILFAKNVLNRQSIGTEISSSQGWGWGGGMGQWGVTANGYGISFWDNEKFLELHSGDGYTILWIS